MAKMYWIPKGCESVKYGKGKRPWLRYQKYRVACVALILTLIAETGYIIWTMN